jgi:hypothetical protein
MRELDHRRPEGRHNAALQVLLMVLGLPVLVAAGVALADLQPPAIAECPPTLAQAEWRRP